MPKGLFTFRIFVARAFCDGIANYFGPLRDSKRRAIILLAVGSLGVGLLFLAGVPTVRPAPCSVVTNSPEHLTR